MDLSKEKTGFYKTKRLALFLIAFLILIGGISAQTEFPLADFWSLDAGVGMSGFLVHGASIDAIVEPKLWLSPALMVGAKLGFNFSFEDNWAKHDPIFKSDILTFDTQLFLRWNFFKFGKVENPVNLFLQGGIGIVAAYRGESNPFDNPKGTRGSILAEGAMGITVPITDRWHIEGTVRGGYPHIWGVSVTAGYKFRLPKKTEYKTQQVTEYVEVIRTLPQNEIIKRITIYGIEFILFGPDIGRYNVGIDRDAQGLNELVLNYIADTLANNPNMHVRIEGHANPVTTDPGEADELMSLSSMRAYNVAAQLRAKGVSDEQMVVIAFGGTRTVTSDHDIWNRNRRVEIMLVEINVD